MAFNREYVCRHLQYTKDEIIDVINAQNIQSFEELQDATDIGSVCSTCRDDVETILLEELRVRAANKELN